jgi:choline dehydrogenase-like flavoprotein
MLRDARTIEDGTVLQSDLCILGGGAAGISLAREFIGASESVLVLESGGFDFDSRTQSLYGGEATGTVLDASDPYLTKSRLRYFGGSTNHWEGMCRALDPADFRERDWVPHSGWPLTFEDLVAYYERAAELCQLEGFSLAKATRNPPREAPPLIGGVPGLRQVLFHLSPPTHFGEFYRRELIEAGNVTLVLFANAVELRANAAADRVESVVLRSFAGNQFSVRARATVLASGGIENPRLLLLSNRVQAGGLGNGHDLVGRFFMEHPHLVAGAMCYVPPASHPQRSLDELLGSSARTIGSVGLSESTQREHRLLNCAVEPRVITRGRNVDDFMKSVASLVAEVDAGDPSAHPEYANLLVRAEQAPNPESRVRLTDETDEFGKRRARLDWRLSELDRTSLVTSLETLGRCLGEAGGGRVSVNPELANSWPRAQGGSHHLGTTRMHRDPKRGVVDEHARVHSVSNLYVAGSSVFPTGGFANPTLTLVALTLRLAAHLKKRLRAE